MERFCNCHIITGRHFYCMGWTIYTAGNLGLQPQVYYRVEFGILADWGDTFLFMRSVCMFVYLPSIQACCSEKLLFHTTWAAIIWNHYHFADRRNLSHRQSLYSCNVPCVGVLSVIHHTESSSTISWPFLRGILHYSLSVFYCQWDTYRILHRRGGSMVQRCG